jgi:hypothetical protein
MPFSLQVFRVKLCSDLPHACYMSHSYHRRFNHANNTWSKAQIMKLLSMQFFYPVTTFLLGLYRASARVFGALGETSALRAPPPALGSGGVEGVRGGRPAR